MPVTLQATPSKNQLQHVLMDGKPLGLSVRQLPQNGGKWTVTNDNDGSLWGLFDSAQAAAESAVARRLADDAATEREHVERAAYFQERGWID